MLNQFKKYILCLFFLFSLTSFLAAQEAAISDFLNVYNYTSDKVSQLAGAIPEEMYDWRPAEGIRSVRESVLHSTGANYFFGSFLGATPPEGLDPQSLEKSGMSKEEAIAAFKTSVEVVQKSLKALTAEQLEEKVDFFGNKITKRQAVFALGDHAAEHLGQLIAYARSNGVTPPWSKKNQ